MKAKPEAQYWSKAQTDAATTRADNIAGMARNVQSETVFRLYLRETARPNHAHWSMYNNPKDPKYYAKDEI